MKKIINHINQILIQRLEKKGIDGNKIPGFLRDLANFDHGDPSVDLFYINKRMRYLGWNDLKIDYHTLQLAIAFFEAERLNSS